MKKRGRILQYFYPRFGRCPSAASLLLSCLCPAFFFSCGMAEENPPVPERTQIQILRKTRTVARTLDLFFFNDDPLMTLDAYQRFEAPVGDVLDGASRTGGKIVAAIVNMPGDKWSWSDINSFQRLSERVSELTEDRPDAPVMSGTCRIVAGKARRADLVLEPLSSRIVLHSLCCDFHARPYKDAVLEDIDVYLVNVNRACRIFDDGSETIPFSWLNMGGREDTCAVAYHLDRLDGTVLPDAVMFCYPNAPAEEGFGRPFTRMVIEATLNGERYYYPVNIPSVGRNQTILLNVTVTRTGTPDPDIPAGSDMVRGDITILPWNEIDAYTVLF